MPGYTLYASHLIQAVCRLFSRMSWDQVTLAEPDAHALDEPKGRKAMRNSCKALDLELKDAQKLVLMDALVSVLTWQLLTLNLLVASPARTNIRRSLRGQTVPYPYAADDGPIAFCVQFPIINEDGQEDVSSEYACIVPIWALLAMQIVSAGDTAPFNFTHDGKTSLNISLFSNEGAAAIILDCALCLNPKILGTGPEGVEWAREEILRRCSGKGFREHNKLAAGKEAIYSVVKKPQGGEIPKSDAVLKRFSLFDNFKNAAKPYMPGVADGKIIEALEKNQEEMMVRKQKCLERLPAPNPGSSCTSSRYF